MASDPLLRIARERALLLRDKEISEELEVQFLHVQGGRPVVAIWRLLRDDAAQALVAMITIDAENINAMRDAQRRVLIYDDFVRTCRAVMNKGIDAEKIITGEELDELYEELRDDDEAIGFELGMVSEPTDI